MWRSKLIMIIFFLGFTIICFRAIWVQFIGNDFFLHQGDIRYTRTVNHLPMRGNILDRDGRVLASSAPAKSIWADRKQAKPSQEELQVLAALLEIDSKDLEKRLSNVRAGNFVWLKRHIDFSLAEKIASLKIKGIYERLEHKRHYPLGAAISQVVGFSNVEGRGQEGIELNFESELSGFPGLRRVLKDRLGKVIAEVGEEVAPINGSDIQLSIDSTIQHYTYQKISEAVIKNKATSGSAVVLDAMTGEVLALANYPSFDPLDRNHSSFANSRNTAVVDSFEPGSAIKPLAMGAALQLKKLTPLTTFDTRPGVLNYQGSRISDVGNFGVLTAREVIAKSSNIGMVKVADLMKPEEMWHMYSLLGIGRKPEIEFPGASGGRLRHWHNWRPVEQATMAYGYGLSMSLLQLATAYTAIAGDGRLRPAYLLKNSKPPESVRVFSEEVAEELRNMIWLSGGAGRKNARANTEGYSVGGKSGTTRKLIDGVYQRGSYRSWFVGMSPISNSYSRIIVAVMIDEPRAGKYYGSAVAAPIFNSVISESLRLMGYQPDTIIERGKQNSD